MDMATSNAEPLDADTVNCCNIPPLTMCVQAANSDCLHRSSPARELLRETSSEGAGVPLRETIHGESDSVRRNDLYRLQAL